MADPNLAFALKLPPEKISEYFSSKNLQPSWDWQDIWQDAHTKTFTVAKVTKLDILQDIQQEVQKAIDNGTTLEDFKKNLEPKLKARGWWGKQKQINPKTGKEEEVQLGSPWRLKTIYQTNIQTAYMSGRYERQIEVVKHRPFWKYVAKIDNKTRPDHSILNGQVFRYDDPFWDTHYPPNGFRCRCSVTNLTQKEIDAGNITVETSEGKIFEKPEKNGTVIGIRVYDKKSGLFKVVYTDPGWNYNPGKASWNLNPKNYNESLWENFKKNNKDDYRIPFFKTEPIIEAEKKALETITKKVNYSTMDAEIAQMTNNHIFDRLNSLNHMPEKLDAILVENIDTALMAMSQKNNILYISKNYIKKEHIKKQWNLSQKYKYYRTVSEYFLEEDIYKAVLDHELGHIVMNKFGGTIKEPNLSFLNQWERTQKLALLNGWSFPSVYAENGNQKKHTDPKDLKNSQLRECFSECFVLYINNQDALLSPNIIAFFDKLRITK